MNKFDSKTFIPLLKEAISSSYKAIKEEAKNEHIYCYALIIGQDLNYIMPVSNSIEGLNEFFSKHPNKDSENIEERTKSIKWSFGGDWKYFQSYDEKFSEVDEILSDFSDLLEEHENRDDYENFYSYYDNSISRCIEKAFKELEKEGVFGTKKERKNIILLYFTDYPCDYNEILEVCKRLNPISIYEELFDEIGEKITGDFFAIGSRFVDESDTCELSKNGEILASSGYSCLFAWKIKDEYDEIFLYADNDYKEYESLAISKDGNTLFASWYQYDSIFGVEIWNIKDKTKKNLNYSEKRITNMVLSEEEDKLFLVAFSGEILKFDLITNELEFKTKIFDEFFPMSLKILNDTKIICSSCNQIKFLDYNNLNEFYIINEGAKNLTISPSGKYLGYIFENSIKILDLKTYKKIIDIEVGNGVTCLEFNSKEDKIIYGIGYPSDGKCVLYDFNVKKELEFFQTGKYMRVKSLKLINNEHCVALVGSFLRKEPVYIWNLKTVL